MIYYTLIDINHWNPFIIMKNIQNKSTICIFSALYLPSMGGVENYTYNLSKALIDLGYNVVIVTNNSHNSSFFETTPEGVEIYRLPCINLIDSRLPIPRFGKKYQEIKSHIDKIDPDYTLINTRFYPLCITAVRFSERKKITPIIVEHGSAYLTLNNRLTDSGIRLYEHALTNFLKLYNPSFYGISQASNKWLKTFNIDSLGTINNAIDADVYYANASRRDFKKELGLRDESFLVTFIGRLIPEKGILSVIEAAKQLRSLNKNVIFLIAGTGSLSNTIKQKSLNNLFFLGKLSRQDIASLLKTSDLFCLPSRSEGFSTSLLEAAACYTPSIITKVGGVAELIPNSQYGIVLENGTATEIVEKILYLEKNRNLAQIIGQNSGKRVRQFFSWEKTALKAIDACERANNN